MVEQQFQQVYGSYRDLCNKNLTSRKDKKMSPALAEAIERRNLDVKPDPDSTDNKVAQELGHDVDGQLLGCDPRLEAIFPELGGIATQPADFEPVDPQEALI